MMLYSNMSIVCVAVIGKDNDPLYLRTFPPADAKPSSQASIADDALKLYYQVAGAFCSVTLPLSDSRASRAPKSLDFVSACPSVHLLLRIQVHTSLDVIEEKINSNKKFSTAGTDLYLGLLFSIEECKVPYIPVCAPVGAIDGKIEASLTAPSLCLLYPRVQAFGYATNTKVKFVVVYQEAIGEINPRAFCKDLHALYVATMCNPFCKARFTEDWLCTFMSLFFPLSGWPPGPLPLPSG